MIWETSLLDPEEGIRFRGLSIPELQVKLVPALLVSFWRPGPVHWAGEGTNCHVLPVCELFRSGRIDVLASNPS